jgi:hypothetical protein
MNKQKFKTNREVFDNIKPVTEKEWMDWAEQNPTPRIDLETLNKISKLLLERNIK